MKKIFIPEQFWVGSAFEGLPVPLTIVYINGFSIKGYPLDLDSETLNGLLECSPEVVARLLVRERVDNRLISTDREAYFFDQGDAPHVETAIDHGSEFKRMTYEPILEAMQDTLLKLAFVSGKHVHLHLCSHGSVQYPYNDSDTVHIVLGAVPPGENQEFVATHVDDVRLQPSGHEVAVPGVAHGYGLVVHDRFNQRIGQVVGTTLYLFVPVDDDSLHLLAANGTDLFAVALGYAWRVFTARDKVELLTKRLETAEEYGQYLVSMIQRLHDNVDAKVKRVDERIANYRRIIAELLLERRLMLAQKSKGIFEVVDQSALEGWEVLRTHPLIDYLEHPDSTYLHVHTKDVVVQDAAGVERYLGRFIIRISRYQKVHVWSKCLPHPTLVPHPHIGASGSVCFGNVTNEVDELLTSGQDEDLICLILDWLQNGYDESLADAKIEEWPVFGDDSKQVHDLEGVFVGYEGDVQLGLLEIKE
ncbi:MAG: hypothetical protein KC877_04910 [Candidatus Kaiserbacteria bacterium]|nr:hypothetical protein [Candidatus Kaiserbacteria bacterium]MCB9816416.1 hypothetical protein [Candidatus Nomurabacteria bacterium]